MKKKKSKLYDVEIKTVVRGDTMVFNLESFGETPEQAIRIAENNTKEVLRTFYQVKSNTPWDSIDKWLEATVVFKTVATVATVATDKVKDV